MSFRARDFVRTMEWHSVPPRRLRRDLRRVTPPEDHLAEKVGDMFTAIAAELREAMPEAFALADEILAERKPMNCEHCGKYIAHQTGSGHANKRFCNPSCCRSAYKKRQRKRKR